MLLVDNCQIIFELIKVVMMNRSGSEQKTIDRAFFKSFYGTEDLKLVSSLHSFLTENLYLHHDDPQPQPQLVEEASDLERLSLGYLIGDSDVQLTISDQILTATIVINERQDFDNESDVEDHLSYVRDKNNVRRIIHLQLAYFVAHPPVVGDFRLKVLSGNNLPPKLTIEEYNDYDVSSYVTDIELEVIMTFKIVPLL